MDQRLIERMQHIGSRLRRFQLGWQLALASCLSALAAQLLAASVAAGSISANHAPWMWLGATIIAFVVLAIVSATRYRQPTEVAQRLEQHFPTLKQGLLTACSVRPASTDGALGYLQQSVIANVLRHDFTHRWYSLIPSSRMWLAWLPNIPALGLLIVAGIELWNTPAPEIESQRAKLPPVQLIPGAPPIISPGNTEIERGSNLIIVARFPAGAPNEVVCTVNDLVSTEQESPNTEEPTLSNQRPMQAALDDLEFSTYITNISQPFIYEIDYDGQKSESFHVEVFDYPGLITSDALLKQPGYTGQESRLIPDTRRISVAEGTTVTWQLTVNKSLESIVLTPEVGDPLSAQLKSADSNLWEVTATLTESTQWELTLRDASGRTNPDTLVLRAKVLPNQEAKIQLTAGGDADVSPLEEYRIAAKISDDFTLQSAGITYQFASSEPVEKPLAVTESSKRVKIEELIDFEALAATPNQLLSYFVWADDIDNQGILRRTMSDIYFLEVRPFDEIYRQGQQPTESQQERQQQQAGEGQGGSEETQELVELQKQILAGTWNVIRALSISAPDKRKADIELLEESQRSAIDLLAEKAAQAPPELAAFAESAQSNMISAAEQLAASASNESEKALRQAFSSEQAAYQDLLRMQSREHEIVQSSQNSSQSQQTSRSARQQQINQLRMDAQENRYEEERLAQDQESQEEAETRQVISRLRELAARQEDINKQLRELEAALQVADEADKEELQRELERLREQQQEMLQDTDELQERLEEQPSETLDAARQEMQEVRENLQQSAEQLRQGDTAGALASGTRAQQDLDEMQDDIRNQIAGEFAEDVRSMQQQAAELEQRQSELVEKLRDNEPADDSGLRANDARSEARDDLLEQQARLKQLLDEMQETVEQAEDTEPLLAQRLYDGFRRARQERTSDKLDMSTQLLERDMLGPATQEAASAIEDLALLREDINSAAEAILGSEVESLQRAVRQLEQLNSELQRGRPDTEDQAPAENLSAATEPSQTSVENQSPNDNDQASQSPGQSASASRQDNQEESDAESTSQQQGQQGQAAGPPRLRGGDTPNAGRGQQTLPDEASQQRQAGGSPQNGQFGGGEGGAAAWADLPNPLTSDGFREWSDRLRDVEELVTDPELRWEATQIRQRARELRTDFKRHSAEPRWSEVEDLVAQPLRDLTKAVSQELLRKVAKKTEVVPLDRDPVPPEFTRSVEQYYENLGSDQ